MGIHGDESRAIVNPTGGLFMKISLVFLFVICTSCSKHSEVIMDKNKVVGIHANEGSVYDGQVMEWKVGDFHSKTLSKGFLLKIALPKLGIGNIEKILEQTKVDSWLVKVIRRNHNGEEIIMGHIYLPFYHVNQQTGNRRVEAIESLFVKIYYAPAALSARLEGLKCPAMDHRKVIDEIEAKQGKLEREFYISYSNQFDEKVLPAEILPHIFNGGLSLIGEYTAQVALYSFTANVRYSEFIDLPGSVKVTKEIEKAVEECNGVAVPSMEHDEKLKQFKFK